jgi:hypothetical protein
MKSPCSGASEKVMVGVLEVCESALVGVRAGKRPGAFACSGINDAGGVTLCERVRVSAPEINHPFFRHYYASRVALSLFRRLSVCARDTLLKSKE